MISSFIRFILVLWRDPREERGEKEEDSKEYGAYGLGYPHVTLADTEGGNIVK